MATSDPTEISEFIQFFSNDRKVSTPKSKVTEEDKSKRSLQTLQSSATDTTSLVGKHFCVEKVKLGVKGAKKLTMKGENQLSMSVYEDESKEKKSTCEMEDEAYSLLVAEEVPENYWKDLAEERRCALEDSLTENEELHKEIGELQTENDRLGVIAGQAEYLASVLKELVDEDDQTEASSVVSDTSHLTPDHSSPPRHASMSDNKTQANRKSSGLKPRSNSCNAGFCFKGSFNANKEGAVSFNFGDTSGDVFKKTPERGAAGGKENVSS